ncbi:uncharacterized protein ACJ7VT_016030 [Polymixia lowei]
MEEIRSLSPMLRLDLDNFDATEAEQSRYVLTSPRSLDSCARLGIKPVELLIKSLNEFIVERRDMPFGAVTVMHESYEKERRRLLKLCREERERIIKDAGDTRLDTKKLSALETVLELASGSSDSKSKDENAVNETTGSIPHLEQSLRRKSVSRSTCSAKGEQNGLRPDKNRVSSLSLGDLRQSPATEMQLKRLTRDIKKEMRVTVSERDHKIAALMLVKHQEEQAHLKLCQQEEQERQETRRQEEAQRAQTEKKRRKKLKQSMQRWHEEVEARRRLRQRQEKELAGLLEQEVQLQEHRWMRLTDELEAHRRQKMEAARKEAEVRKRYQEKLLRDKDDLEKMQRERERQVALEREQKARRSRMTQEKRERKRLQQDNHRELLRHILLKQQAEQQVREEEALMRSALEQKLHHSWEKRAQASGARLRELQQRAAQEAEQIQEAQLRAKQHSHQQLRHKQVLVQLSQRRMERAAQHTSAQFRDRAQRARQYNQNKQRCHQQLRDRVQREEEAQRVVRESYLMAKEHRRERLQRQQEQIQEEARSVARASYHMRERVRRYTQCRTFDQMALEAELSASLGRIKL